MIFGIDVGGTTVKIGLVDNDGNIVDKWAIRTNKADEGVHILPDIYKSIQEYCDKKRIDLKSISGFGFGIPGPIKNSFVLKTPNLPWNGLNVREEFIKILGFDAKVAAGNDATVAGAGELWKIDGEYKDVVMVTLGTGVGGGIILNGKPIDGSKGAGGEIGHMHVDNKYNFTCGCGNVGCLETVTSATGVTNIFKANYDKSKTSLDISNLSSKRIFNAAEHGDVLALEVVDEVSMYLGSALAMISAVVDPEVFIIGGGVSAAGEFLLSRVRKAYKEKAFFPTKETKIVRAQLGNDAGIVGAAYLVR